MNVNKEAPCCDRCGAADATELGDVCLCAGCFQLAGASCGGGDIRGEVGQGPRGPGGAGAASGDGNSC